MTDDQRELLQEARDSVSAARVLLDAGYPGYAASRAYYAMFYVAEALEHYFADYVDAQIAKDRFNDPRSKIIAGAELRKRLGV